VAGAVWRGAQRTRREAIKQGLALVGAAGAGALVFDSAPAAADDGNGGTTTTSTTSTTVAGASPGAPGIGAGKGAQVTLIGAGLDVSGAGFVPGSLPGAGQQLFITGKVLDAGGSPVGQLFGTYVQLVPFGQAGPNEPVSLLDEVLQLDGGTVCGRGLVLANPSTPTTFAITGGTGRHAGLTGAWTGSQQFLSLGGDGSAQFTFTTTGEAGHDGAG
jgi:hypothetical protein